MDDYGGFAVAVHDARGTAACERADDSCITHGFEIEVADGGVADSFLDISTDNVPNRANRRAEHGNRSGVVQAHQP